MPILLVKQFPQSQVPPTILLQGLLTSLPLLTEEFVSPLDYLPVGRGVVGGSRVVVVVVVVVVVGIGHVGVPRAFGGE